MLPLWGGEIRDFDVKLVHKGQITNIKRLQKLTFGVLAHC